MTEGKTRSMAAGQLLRVNVTTSVMIVVVLGLLVRLAHFWSISHTPFTQFPLVLKTTDLYANWQWAQTILAGDLLGRDTYHPYFDWMQKIAPLERWYQWWGGKEVFQQAPLYTYWTAGLLAVSNNSLDFVVFVQLVAGALQVLIMFYLGRRFFNEHAGLVAAALTAFYGPFIFHQGVLVRDWMPPILDSLALLLLLRARSRGTRHDYLFAGAALGAALLGKETLLLFLPLVFLWMAWEERFAWRRFLARGGFLLLGLLVVVSPLIIRNVWVGAPWFALSNRAAEQIIQGNAAGIVPIGMNPPPSMKGILERSGGKLVPVIYETLGSYDGNWPKLARVQIVKLRALIDPFEIPNNVSFYYGLEISPVLSLTLRYALILPLGLAGLVFAIWRRRGAALLLLYGGAIGAGLLIPPIMARYRLQLVPVLILYAAEGLTCVGKYFRESWWVPALYSGAVLVLFFSQYMIAIPYGRNSATHHMLHGGLDHHFAAMLYAQDNQFEKSIAELRRLEENALDTPNSLLYSSEARYEQGIFYAKWAEALLKSGDRVGANEKAMQAESKFSPYFDKPEASVTMGVLYYDLQRTDKARTYLEHALRIEPEGPDAETAKTYLRKLLVSAAAAPRDGK